MTDDDPLLLACMGRIGDADGPRRGIARIRIARDILHDELFGGELKTGIRRVRIDDAIAGLGAAIGLTRSLSEERYTQLTGRMDLESARHAASEVFVGALCQDGGFYRHDVEQAYRVLDAACAMLCGPRDGER